MNCTTYAFLPLLPQTGQHIYQTGMWYEGNIHYCLLQTIEFCHRAFHDFHRLISLLAFIIIIFFNIFSSKHTQRCCFLCPCCPFEIVRFLSQKSLPRAVYVLTLNCHWILLSSPCGSIQTIITTSVLAWTTPTNTCLTHQTTGTIAKRTFRLLL